MCAVLYDIDHLRHEIDRLDAEILAAVKRRTEVSQAIGISPCGHARDQRSGCSAFFSAVSSTGSAFDPDCVKS